ncbi:diphthine--ammonia ligase [archaeon]|nr:diphthine--ammonia ligase [archaeon]MBT3577907.1 diphthine--ammonia ligase [archaeon]MBT6819729.1 diphthine--ammonia ligase [archaeon]MBT6956013.1 diphthine--ammonia ligase [archaeon]MBT7025512.1 diphthine--ammonia ligase [archaeon]
MKLAVLFSGGKDSTYAAWLAKKYGYDLTCLISIQSENKESFMFHVPSISQVKIQAERMNVPLILQKTKGEKEIELKDMEKAIKQAIKDYGVGGIVTGAVESVYQASRVQEICNRLGIECFNPLWQKDQWELMEDLMKEKFEVIVVGVFAYPFDESWLGRKVDKKLLGELRKIHEELKINPAGEGGEFETLVLKCPLFDRGLKIKEREDIGEGHSWRMEVTLE